MNFKSAFQGRFQMLTTIMSWVSVAILFLAALGLLVMERPLLASLVCVSGLLIVRRAVHARKYSWAVGFVAVAVLFNPAGPVVGSGSGGRWVNWIALVMFVWTAVRLNERRTLTVQSITNSMPRRESL